MWKCDLVGSPNPIEALSVTHNGKWLCAASSEGSVLVWDLQRLFKKSKEGRRDAAAAAAGFTGTEAAANAQRTQTKGTGFESESEHHNAAHLHRPQSRGSVIPEAAVDSEGHAPLPSAQKPPPRSRGSVVDTPGVDGDAQLPRRQQTPNVQKPNPNGTPSTLNASDSNSQVPAGPRRELHQHGLAIIQQKLIAHKEAVRTVSFNCRCDTLCTASADGTARVWRLFGQDNDYNSDEDNTNVSGHDRAHGHGQHASPNRRGKHADAPPRSPPGGQMRSERGSSADGYGHGHNTKNKGTSKIHSDRPDETQNPNDSVNNAVNGSRRWGELVVLHEQDCEVMCCAFGPTYSKLLATIGRDGVVCVYYTDLIHEEEEDPDKTKQARADASKDRYL
jgi:WD40 repeat protein